MISLVSVVVLLGVLIFVHELGHFLVAKRLGVGVLKFSLGFGPRIVGRQIGETEYRLSLIPLGGYVKLMGESTEEPLTPAEEQRSFLKQGVGKRMAIVAAGPLFNLLLAVLIFSLVHMVGVPVMTSEVGGILPGSAAEQAGLLGGDRITGVDGVPVAKWDDLAAKINESRGEALRLTVQREGRDREVVVTPRSMRAKNLFGEEVEGFKIGIRPSPKTYQERSNPAVALGLGVKQTWLVCKLTVISIVKMFQGVVSPKTLGGPILIAQIAGAQVQEGVIPFILFMALLSVNLAVLNLLPIPVLDGGHLLFYGIEMVTGREVNLRWREMAQQIGFVILILLMVFVFLMDIERLNIRFISDFIKGFTG